MAFNLNYLLCSARLIIFPISPADSNRNVESGGGSSRRCDLIEPATFEEAILSEKVAQNDRIATSI